MLNHPSGLVLPCQAQRPSSPSSVDAGVSGHYPLRLSETLRITAEEEYTTFVASVLAEECMICQVSQRLFMVNGWKSGEATVSYSRH